jgi:DNA-binding GntR family transcriptional regulator
MRKTVALPKTKKRPSGGDSPTGGPDLPWARIAASVKQRGKHGSMTDAVTDALREAILDGALPSSTWLKEDQMAQALAVSRTPIRESLRRLADEHLVSRVANRGSMVQPMTIDDVFAVYLIREALERLAVFTVASRLPNGLLDQLIQIQNNNRAAVADKKVSDAHRYSVEFHRAIRQATQNRYLVRFLDQVENMVRRSGVRLINDPDHALKNLEDHQTIIDAIAIGDPEKAQDAVSDHLRRARGTRINAMMGPSPGSRT